MVTMELLQDGSEKVQYDYEGYRAYVREGLLSRYPNYAADSHWHSDVEFIYIRSGEMQYRINDRTVMLHQGEGIFVNARQLHYGFSDTRAECAFICILLHPDLLCASQILRKQFVEPIIYGGEPYLLLRPSVTWQAALMDELQYIAAHRDDLTAPLMIQQHFFSIWSFLWENTPRNIVHKQPDHRLSMVKEMVTMIQNRYMEKLTLEDIASSISVSKNTCLNLFRTYLNDTPGNYVIAYRVKMAAELLLNTNRTIADIALSVGFASSSHFSDTFKSIYGCTPREYRADR